MRILISAYACEPGKGSEPEVGLQVALIAAKQHEIWLVTRENNLPALEDCLAHHPLGHRIHLVGLEVGGLAKRLKKRGGLLTLHWYYDKWQRHLAGLAARLDAEHDFDVVHHATFASYWTRAGVASVDKPLVWGPVGGGVIPPVGLLPVMGMKGVVGDLLRVTMRPLLATFNRAHRLARRASVVLVQNPETARRLGSPSTARVLPHALAGIRSQEPVDMETGQLESSPRVVSVGRLVGWKGTELAIRATQFFGHPSVTLDIYGDGPRLRSLKRLAIRIGKETGVRFLGHVPREQLLAALTEASVLVHPALHDDSPLSVAEALSLGTPVVCLDRGGPPVILDQWPDVPSHLVPPSTPRRTAELIARAIDELIGQRGPPNTEPASYFAEQLLDVYSAAANGSTS